MDQRRIPELAEAAVRGAARNSAADARQRSIQAAMASAAERQASVDVDMLDAGPLSGATSGLDRVMSLMRSGSLPGSPAFRRQASTETFSSDSASEPCQRPVASIRPTIADVNPTGAHAQRQNSGNLASTSYTQPAAPQRLQRNSWKDAAPSQVIDLDDDDDDTPPSFHVRNGRPIINGNCQPRQGPQARHTMPSSSSPFVDLTVESPPRERSAARQPANRVNLEAIGRHTLRAGSADVSAQPSGSQPTAQRRPTRRMNSRNPSNDAMSSRHAATQLDLLQDRHAGSMYAALDLSNGGHASSLPHRESNGTASQPSFDYLDCNRPRAVNSLDRNSDRNYFESSRTNGARVRHHPAEPFGHAVTNGASSSTDQEDLDLALAMSLAAEDEEEASYAMPPPRPAARVASTRTGPYGMSGYPRHPPTAAYHSPDPMSGYLRHHPAAAYQGSDPMAAIAHSLLGGSRFDEESSHALLASLMADFEAAGGMTVSSAMGNGHQDMSYEALTNLEDVKLTAPPELLATMPLDMCLKGGIWEQKACSICQSEYEPDEVIMILPCEHHFHKDCAMEWLSKHSKKCPICKESIGG